MQIIIAGAGTIGRHIADMLQQEQHDVAMIELDRAKLQETEDLLDVRTLPGSANDPDVLAQAGIESADLFLAMTNKDETNLISSMTARQLGAQKSVARVRQPFYHTTEPIHYCDLMNIDMIISPEWLTALEIVKHINRPDAIAIESFAGGRLQLRQFRISPGCPYLGTPLTDLRGRLPKDLLVAMIAHEEDLIIPRGDSTIAEGDRVTVLGLPESVDRFGLEAGGSDEQEKPIEKVFIAGGGMKALFLAQMLEQQNYSVTMMERDRARCELLSNLLEKTRVVLGDATRLPVLKEERVAKADLFVGAMGDDEDNLLSCLQVKSLGLERAYTVMNRPDYAATVEQFGIPLALSPRHIIANRVLALIKRGKVRSLSLIENARAEVVELTALPDTPAVEVPLTELKMPQGALIALIVRGGQALIPRGDTVIHPGDTVITLSLAQHSAEVERLFGSRNGE